MKTIDQTPFRGEDGIIKPMDRIQATVKFGPSWYGEIQAQDAVKAVFTKHLGRGFYLLQNAPLPGVQDVRIPLILAGPAGVFLFYVSNERGLYRAKGEEWGTMKGDSFTPAKINIIKMTMRMASAAQKYLNTQGYEGAVKVDSILLAMNPGMHIDSSRPAIRVIMSDALERFAISMSQAQPVLSAETAQQVIDRIADPHPVKKPAPQGVPGSAPRPIPADSAKPAGQPASAQQQKPASAAPQKAAAPAAKSAPQAKPQPTGKPAPQAAKGAKPAPAKKRGMDSRKLMIIGSIVFVIVVVLLLAAIFAGIALNA